MTSIPVRELSQHTSEILARAEHGETFVVTKNGRPIARVIPIDRDERAFQDLVASGAVTHPGGEPGWIRDWAPASAEESAGLRMTLDEAVAADRDDER